MSGVLFPPSPDARCFRQRGRGNEGAQCHFLFRGYRPVSARRNAQHTHIPFSLPAFSSSCATRMLAVDTGVQPVQAATGTARWLDPVEEFPVGKTMTTHFCVCVPFWQSKSQARQQLRRAGGAGGFTCLPCCRFPFLKGRTVRSGGNCKVHSEQASYKVFRKTGLIV